MFARPSRFFASVLARPSRHALGCQLPAWGRRLPLNEGTEPMSIRDSKRRLNAMLCKSMCVCQFVYKKK